MSPFPEVRFIGITGIPMVQAGDDLAELIFEAAERQGTALEEHDVLVVTQRVASKAEGRVLPLDSFEPSPFALALRHMLNRLLPLLLGPRPPAS